MPTFRDPNDGRSRYSHQAYDVTYLGKAKETGSVGVGARLSATYAVDVQVLLDPAVAVAQYNLAAYTFITGYSLPIPTDGGAVPTLTVTISELDGSAPINVVLGLDPTVVVADAQAAELAGASSTEKLVTVTLDTNGGTQRGVLLLHGNIIETEWK